MADDYDEILDGIFHACAFTAFVEEARAQKGPPGLEATRQRAYRLYEDALAERHAIRSARPMLTGSSNVPISSIDHSRDLMPETMNQAANIQIGDTVHFHLSVGGAVSEAKGKVIGLFNTRDGQTMADVLWDKLGPPKRINVRSLAKAQPSDTSV
jgi:hypothetical protein